MLDVVGAIVGFDLLAIDRVAVSPINTGSGWVQTAHGRLPVPAPATARLLAGSGAIAYGSDVKFELLTPTGAAVLTRAGHEYGPLPAMRVERTGYGAGTASLSIPNVLRVTLGESVGGHEADTATVIETNIDDMNPEVYEYVTARLFAAGALDVWTAPIVMKGGRPATQLSALAPNEAANALIDMILTETTTLGVRTHQVQRTKLRRASFSVTTPYGEIRVKASYLHGALRDVAPRPRTAEGLRQKAAPPGATCTMPPEASVAPSPPPGPSPRTKVPTMRRSDADVVPSTQAEVVRLNEAAVGTVRAGRVVANRTTMRRADARQVEADRSLILVNSGDQLRVTRGVLGGATSLRTHVRNGALGVNVSGNAKLENVAASWVVAGNVQADRVLSLAVVGGNVSGNVRSLFGTRAAIAFGIALGVSSLAARLIGRLLR